MNSRFDGNRWLKFLSWFCPADVYEEIEGDLIERYEHDVVIIGARKAKRKLIRSVLGFLRPGIILRNSFSLGLNPGIMLRSYATVLFRNVMRKKLYSAINIIGLTAGIAFAMLIGVFIWTELQVNKSLKDVDDLYILESKFAKNDFADWFVPNALAPRMMETHQGMVADFYRFYDRNITISKDDKHFRIQSMVGDSSFLDVFGFEVVSSLGKNPLGEPNSIIITENVAERFFDRTDVAGQTLDVAIEGGGKREFKITAVIKNPEKKNTVTDLVNMNAEVFLSLANKADFSLSFYDPDNWNDNILTYVRVKKGIDRETAQLALTNVFKRYAPAKVSEDRTVMLNPLTDYYTTTNKGAVKSLLRNLALIVVFMLVLAIANFINISIGGSFSRLKEIGVRKVIGGVRRQVIFQFLSESILISLFSGLLALGVYEGMHGYLGTILGATLPSAARFGAQLWMWILIGLVSVGVLAGGYPSLFLSGAGAGDSLKGKFKSVSGAIYFSRVLISTQFLVAIFVFIAALIMSEQTAFFFKKDLGYNKSAVLVVTSAPRLWNEAGYNRMEAAKREFLAAPVISAMSLSTGSPAASISMGGDRMYLTGTSDEKAIDVTVTASDEDFARVYDMKIVAGKFFNAEGGPHQPNTLVVNEAAATALKLQIGDRLKLKQTGDVEFTLVGVVKDFHVASLHEAVAPLVIFHSRDNLTFRHYAFKLNSTDLHAAVVEVEALWRKIFPEDAFVYSFADDQIQQQYKTELQLKKASTIASVLMLIIVLTGVLGLVSLNVARRNREIGIRKVLGASASSILSLLSKEYLIVIVIAFAVGVPPSYLFMRSWLATFIYHIDIQVWMFAAPMLLLALLTLAVVALQGLGAAMMNPVKALRSVE